MKKTVFILLVSSCALNGCHPTTPVNQPENSVKNVTVIDTSQMQVSRQAADTTIKDGPLVTRYENGVIKEKSYYLAGRRQGECQSFYPSGKMWSDDYFTNGLRDGATTTYYDNGQKRYEGTFIKGKPSGKWNYYDNSGKLTRLVNYGKKAGSPAI